MSKRLLALSAAVLMAGSLSFAAPSKDHDILRTLQSLKEKSLHKRLMNLSAMGPEAYRQLQEISFDSAYPAETRAEAFRTAVTLGREQSAPEIKRASEHRDWFMRALALEAYGHLEPAKAKSMARQWLLNDRALMVRAAAFSHLKEEPLIGELQEVFVLALKDQKNFHRGQSLWIRNRIAERLLELSPKSHPEPYLSLLEDLDPRLRDQTQERLRQLYPESWQKIRRAQPEKENLAWSQWIAQMPRE